MARRAVRDALRQSRAPRDDGPRRPQGLAARPDDGLRSADGSGRVGAVLRARHRREVIAAALSGHDRRQLAAAARGRRGACAPYRRGRIDRAELDRIADEAVVGSAAPAGEPRLRHRDRRRAAARQLLLVRRREAGRRPAHDPRRDARRRRGQGRLRAAPPDARRPRLLDQQPDLHGADRAAGAAGRRRPGVRAPPHRPARSRSRCPDPIC